MNKYVIISALLALMSLTMAEGELTAQNYNQQEYLKGAVSEENGEIFFHNSFTVPEVGRDSLAILTAEWINGRNNEDENRESRVLIFNEEEGDVVGGCREKLVFKSTFLSLDQADMSYTLHAVCENGKVDLSIIRISYVYRNDDRYRAEDRISDEVSLNSDKTMLLKPFAKWRTKTVDFSKDLYRDYYNFLVFKTGKTVTPLKEVRR